MLSFSLMESYLYASLAVGLNFLFWLVVIVVESVESHYGLMPQRRSWKSSEPFLYLRDWHMGTWGDLIGLSFVNWVAGYYIFSLSSSSVLFPALCVAFLASSIFFLDRFSGRRIPGSGFPRKGAISIHGVLHLLYFFIQSFLCAGVFLLIFYGETQRLFIILAVSGAVVYSLSFLADWWEGKLEPVRY